MRSLTDFYRSIKRQRFLDRTKERFNLRHGI